VNISEINIVPIKPNNGLIAFASFVLDNSFYFGNIGIYTRLDGSFKLVYPNKILSNGKKISNFYPINRETAKELTIAISEKYNEILKKMRNEYE